MPPDLRQGQEGLRQGDDHGPRDRRADPPRPMQAVAPYPRLRSTISAWRVRAGMALALRLGTMIGRRLASEGGAPAEPAAFGGGGAGAANAALALALIVLTAPLWLVVAIAIRLDTPGAVFFRQTRLGLGGRPFELFKFRTMVTDADAAIHQRHVAGLLGAGGGARGSLQATWRKLDPFDPRITRVGRFLRRWQLDELPQLINVVRGEMRVVGPRPALAYEAERWAAWHRARLDVPPGITGLWQVAGRGRTDFDGAVRQDLLYARLRSPAMDVLLLAATPLAVLRSARGSPQGEAE